MNRSQANSVFSTNVVPIPTASARLVVFEPTHDWRAPVIKRLEQLVKLEPGWDGYGGQPVALENAAFASESLKRYVVRTPALLNSFQELQATSK